MTAVTWRSFRFRCKDELHRVWSGEEQKTAEDSSLPDLSMRLSATVANSAAMTHSHIACSFPFYTTTFPS
jgi:hypothetical protein